jgi:hypothetical protein
MLSTSPLRMSDALPCWPWRLMPFLFVGYTFCFLDRVKVGFAKLQMQQELGSTDTVYGLTGGGIVLVNSMGNLSGFVAPYMLGYIKDATQSLSLGLYSLAALVVLGGILVMAFAPRPRK